MMWKCENVAAEFKVRSRRFSANQASPDFSHNTNNNSNSNNNNNNNNNNIDHGGKMHQVEEKLGSKWKKDAVATFRSFKRAVHFEGKNSRANNANKAKQSKGENIERQNISSTPLNAAETLPPRRSILSQRSASVEGHPPDDEEGEEGSLGPPAGLGDLVERLRFRPRGSSDVTTTSDARAQQRRRSSGADTAIGSMADSTSNGADINGYYSNGSTDSARHASISYVSSQTHRRVTRSSVCSSQGGASVGAPPNLLAPDEGFASSEDVRRPLFVDTNMANAWLQGHGAHQRNALTCVRPSLNKDNSSSNNDNSNDDDEFFAPNATICRRAMSIGAESLQAKRAMGLLAAINRGPHAALGMPAGVAARRRRNSEFGRYLIMRRSQEPGGMNELVAQLEDSSEQAYCQLLCSMKCYDLMPPISKMVVLDSSLTIRKAFGAMASHGYRAAPVIDCKTGDVLGLLTVTDLLRALLGLAKENGDLQLTMDAQICDGLNYNNKNNANNECQGDTSAPSDDSADSCQWQRPAPVFVLAEYNLYTVAKMLCDKRLHRLIVCDSEQHGDPLFLVSKKMILKALHKYIERLPLPACMHASLDDLRLGTWSDLVTVTPDTTLIDCLEKFIERDVSCLPVVSTEPGKEYCLLNILTKTDIVNMVVDEWETYKMEMLHRTVQHVIEAKRDQPCPKLVTCQKRMSLSLGVEALLRAGGQRLLVLDQLGRLEALVSVADLMRFLTGG